jgi:hypothetical protein
MVLFRRAHGNLVDRCTMSEAGREPTVRIPMKSFDFFQFTSTFQSRYGHRVDGSSNRTDYQECSWGVKHGHCVRLTTSLPYLSHSSRKYWILNVSQSCRPLQPVTGIALLVVLWCFSEHSLREVNHTCYSTLQYHALFLFPQLIHVSPHSTLYLC